jgi:predicted ATP-grasp superfamily ATP-dependent carboligase
MNKTDVLILGLAPQGLFLLREFSKAGYRVAAIGLKGSIGLYSRYGRRICISDLEELDSVLPDFLHPGLKCHIASDKFLNYLLDRDHEIFNLTYCRPNLESAKIFTDKLLTADLARSLGIESLQSWKLNEIDSETFDRYPAIVKWNRRYEEYSFKTRTLQSRAQLDLVKQSTANHPQLILQDYIQGGPENDISYGGYFQDGEEITSIVISQKRQYPYPSGLASFIQEYAGEYASIIRDYAKKLLGHTRYSGFVEVECRVDALDSRLVLIEINPRACGWIKIIGAKISFLRPFLRSKDNSMGRPLLSWVNLSRDVRAIYDMLRKTQNFGEIKSIMFDYFNKPALDILDLKDLRPFVSQFVKLL